MPPISRDTQPDVERRREDLDLTRAAARGDEEARREVARRLHDRVAGTVRYLRGVRPDTPDLVQTCLVELLRSLGGFRGESRLETWADRIAVRTTMRELGREQKRLQDAAASRVEQPGSPVEDPERRLGREELQSHVAAMLQKLSPERRLVMVLRAVHGYTMKIGISCGLLLTGFLLNAAGFDAKLGADQAPRAILYLRIMHSAIPATALLLAIVLVARYPITPGRAAWVRAELEKRHGA